MVNYNPKAWVALIFHSYSRHVVKTLLPVLIIMGLFTAAVCYVILDYVEVSLHQTYRGNTAVHSLLGIVLGLFLVFRTNSAYDRWWEGRKLWGGIVNSTRNLAFKLNACLDERLVEDRTFFAKMIPNFVFAVKEHLRGGIPQYAELEETDDKLFEKLKRVKHKPNYIATQIFQRMNKVCSEGHISGEQLITLDREMSQLTEMMGGCERIKNTPIPYSYSMYIKKFIFLYIVTLPFGFVTTFGYFTIITVILVSFVLLSVELICEAIEDPFGRDLNDLPTDELSERIRENIREIMDIHPTHDTETIMK
jgi:putative membrane protein